MVQAAERALRTHLGASQIGKPCWRELFYGFRWAAVPEHSGRILRLFARGQREESMFVEHLRRLGAEVLEFDPNGPPGTQFRVSAHGGHFGGSLDGVARGVPEFDPQEWLLLEFKTHNAKSFEALLAQGVQRSKRVHYAQIQVYLHLTGLRRALYLAVNKNDDALHCETVAYDALTAEGLLAKAGSVIFATEPPPRVSNSPAYFECKFCDYRDVCHFGAALRKSCRTCAAVRPLPDGQWRCGHWDAMIPADVVPQGCEMWRSIGD